MSKQVMIFPEINHELITPLKQFNDIELWEKWQANPPQARYLLAIFFRHYQLSHLKQTDLIQRYFDKLWFYIFDQLLVHSVSENPSFSDLLKLLTQNYFSFFQEEMIADQTAANQKLIEDDIRYLPLQYFVDKALNSLLPLERIVLVTNDKFAWDNQKTLHYLEQQGTTLSSSELQAYYTKAHSRLINALPTDIVTIYFHQD